MNINADYEPISTSVHYGEGTGYDKNSLKAYKCENEMKRAVIENKNILKFHLNDRFSVPAYIEVKVSEPGETPIIEGFSLVELINDKLTSINSSICLSTYEVFREKGIVEAICYLHEYSPLTVI